MNHQENNTTQWLFEITPKTISFRWISKSLQYRDLLMLFVKRDVVTVYKQTVLGPLWYLIQPLFTSITFTIIFNNLAGIDTGTVPFLFNLAGITVWIIYGLPYRNVNTGSNAGILGKYIFLES
jgi:lipopolysaccharide transport system permease protein